MIINYYLISKKEGFTLAELVITIALLVYYYLYYIHNFQDISVEQKI